MKQLKTFVVLLIIFGIITGIGLIYLCSTPRPLIKNFTMENIVPYSNMQYAFYLNDRDFLKSAFSDDSAKVKIEEFLAQKHSPFLLIKLIDNNWAYNLLAKGILFTKYGDGFVLIGKCNFQTLLVHRFYPGKSSYIQGIRVKRIPPFSYMFIGNFLIVSNKESLLKEVIKLSEDKRRGSLAEKFSKKILPFGIIVSVKNKVFAADPLIVQWNKNFENISVDMIETGGLVGNMFRGNYKGNIANPRVILGVKIPFLEPKDAYNETFGTDSSGLGLPFMDFGGKSSIFFDAFRDTIYNFKSMKIALVSIMRTEPERLIRDLTSSLSGKDSIFNGLKFYEDSSGRTIFVYYLKNYPDIYVCPNDTKIIYSTDSTLIEKILDCNVENKTDGMFYPAIDSTKSLQNLLSGYLKDLYPLVSGQIDSLYNHRYHINMKTKENNLHYRLKASDNSFSN